MAAAVYLLASRRNGTLYVGVTNDLARRAWEHRQGLYPGFSRRYGVKQLVWYEHHESIATAIHREKLLKKYPRQWKINLIEAANPGWLDLYNTLNS
ncbi:MAG TPA: GIY-YIG nuclease family protein [Phenylobacterium sp.]